MLNVQKHILTDERSRPVAVQVRYDDWLKIERLFEAYEREQPQVSLMKYAGRLSLNDDPLEIQRALRSEWP